MELAVPIIEPPPENVDDPICIIGVEEQDSACPGRKGGGLSAKKKGGDKEGLWIPATDDGDKQVSAWCWLRRRLPCSKFG
jgi:hypothetical protein